SLLLGTVFFVLYHSCCLNCFIPRHTKNQSRSEHQNTDSNGQSYMKLKAKSENEVFPLKSKQDKGSKGAETTRSMVTLPANDRDLETSVDEFDDYDHKMAPR